MSSLQNGQNNNGGDDDAAPGPGSGPGPLPDAEHAQCSCKCPICLLPYMEPVVTECGHVFCLDCLNELICTAMNFPRCPLCRKKI